MPDTSAHPLRDALAKFWAPVPWLLEASIVLETILHKYYEAGVIAALLVFNAALAYFQESRAQATLTALKSRLALNASVHPVRVERLVLRMSQKVPWRVLPFTVAMGDIALSYLLLVAQASLVFAAAHLLLAGCRTNDSHRASGSTSYRLRHAAQQEVVNAPLPMRTDCNQIRPPFGSLIENCVCYVTNPYTSLCRESSSAQFGRNSLNQCSSRLLLTFQLRSITLGHLRRGHSVNRLQHV